MKTLIQFNNWLARINNTETVDKEIAAFYFGLIETTNGYTMYLIGSKDFDSDNEDWATNVDFEPQNKYMEFDKSDVEGKKWEDILSVSLKLISDYVNSSDFSNSILKDAKVITVGFDDGNLTRIK